MVVRGCQGENVYQSLRPIGGCTLRKIHKVFVSFFALLRNSFSLCVLASSFVLCFSLIEIIAGQAPLKVCLISASNEYHSDTSLIQFKQYLESHYKAYCSLIQGHGKLNRFGETRDLPGLESLERSDVVLLFTRRVTIPKDQLDRIKRYIDSGKPVVAVRTASHGFQEWLEFDKIFLGGNYQGHFGLEFKQTVTPAPTVQNHPVLEGVGQIISSSSLYKTAPLASDTELLMISSTPQSRQPSAWTRLYKGGRIFYTSLGAPEDFKNPYFLQLLVNALFWTAGRNKVELVRSPSVIYHQ